MLEVVVITFLLIILTLSLFSVEVIRENGRVSVGLNSHKLVLLLTFIAQRVHEYRDSKKESSPSKNEKGKEEIKSPATIDY